MSTYKFNTPEVPDEIRKIRHPAYKNIYEYGLGNQNLWGTETLLGDWDGEYLLIAKDFYPSSHIDAAKKAGDPQPYRHKEDAATNLNLTKTLAHFSRFSPSVSNTACGFLFTSACFLLRVDAKKSGPLTDEVNVVNVCHPALKFTIEHMPNLRHAVLMGCEASRAEHRTPLGDLLRQRDVHIHRVSHPAYWMISDAKRFVEWESVFGEATVVDRTTNSNRWVEPAGRQKRMGQTADYRSLVLKELSTTPKSVADLKNRTNLPTEKDVRNAIDGLRKEYHVWLFKGHGFWIDNPISILPPGKGPPNNWRRKPGEHSPE